MFNSSAPGRCGSNFRSKNVKLIIQNSRLGSRCEFGLRWMSQNLTNAKSTLVQVLAWCRQAPSHYISQCWPRSMSLCGVTIGYIAAWTTWQQFCRRHFHLRILNRRLWYLILISQKFDPMDTIDNESSLVKVMAWRRTCCRPSPKRMVT